MFGYGSLMWQPDFRYVERRPAMLWGWHRAHALISTAAWGSAERPGLILTLLRGGACLGKNIKDVTATGKLSNLLGKTHVAIALLCEHLCQLARRQFKAWVKLQPVLAKSSNLRHRLVAFIADGQRIRREIVEQGRRRFTCLPAGQMRCETCSAKG